MSSFHTTGFVLRIKRVNESDKRVSIYTDTHGKLNLFAKSACRMESKLSPHLEPYTIIDCYVVRGKLDHLAGAERLHRFPLIHSGLSLLAHAAWAAELIDEATREDHADRRIFDLLFSWFSFLERAPHPEIPARLRLIFLIYLYKLLGIGPEFEVCVKCRGIAGKWVFSGREGGLLCASCRTHTRGPIVELENKAVEALREASRNIPAEFSPDIARAVSPRLAALLIWTLIAEQADAVMDSERFINIAADRQQIGLVIS